MSTLPPLPPMLEACPKCGVGRRTPELVCPECGTDIPVEPSNWIHQVRWIPGPNSLVERPLLPYREDREHMQMTCSHCQFSWPAAPADQGGLR